MLTEFGKNLRKIRIDKGELVKDMADKLEVTPSYLSAVENGKRNIPEQWTDKLASFYSLDTAAKAALHETAARSAKTVKLNLDQASADKKGAAVMFARKFHELDESEIFQLQEFIKNLVRKRDQEPI
jgi:transcriptional regulator with XRE-family HTH domain